MKTAEQMCSDLKANKLSRIVKALEVYEGNLKVSKTDSLLYEWCNSGNHRYIKYTDIVSVAKELKELGYSVSLTTEELYPAKTITRGIIFKTQVHVPAMYRDYVTVSACCE